jgi:predicted  nucleic acid-binding Zn-ribbon protein
MKERETERETLREAIDKRRASVAKHETEFAELQRFATEEKAKSETRLAELTAQRDSVLGGRKELAVKIPAQIMRRYELIRSKRAGVGAVPIKGHICAGCNTSLPPNQALAIQNGDTFEQCPHCNRLLFSPEAIAKLEANE